MNRKKIVLRSLFVLVIPVLLAVYERFFHPEGNGLGLVTVLNVMILGGVETVVLLLASVIQYVRAFLVQQNQDAANVLEPSEGKTLRLQYSSKSFLMAALAVALSTVIIVGCFITIGMV